MIRRRFENNILAGSLKLSLVELQSILIPANRQRKK